MNNPMRHELATYQDSTFGTFGRVLTISWVLTIIAILAAAWLI